MRMFSKKGISLVEVIVGLAIFSAFFVSISGLYVFYTKNLLFNTSRLQGVFLTEEGIEAVRFMRIPSWNSISTLSPGTNYHLVFNGNSWSATTTPQTPLPGFTRTFSISNVSRNSSDDVDSTGTNDVNTKKVVVTTSWTSNGTSRSVAVETLLTNVFSD